MPDAGSAFSFGSNIIGSGMEAAAGREAAEIKAAVDREALNAQQAELARTRRSFEPFLNLDLTRSEGMPNLDIYGAMTTLSPYGQQAAEELVNLLGLQRGVTYQAPGPAMGGAGEGQLSPTGTYTRPGASASQQATLDRLSQDPLFLAKVKSGEEALLQNASATGGLRGGNVQAALAQFRPQMLSEEIANRIAQLSGIVEAGSGQEFDAIRIAQSSAAQQAAAAGQAGQTMANIFGNLAQSQAQRAASSGQAFAGSVIRGLPGYAGEYEGRTGRSIFG